MTDALHPIDPQNLLAESARLRGIARRLMGRESGVEDLVQDTWVTAIEADMSDPTLWRDEAGWRAWVGAVTRNLALHRRRRECQRGRVEREAARAESVEPRESIAERLELQRQLADAIQELDEPYRSALVLRYLDGLELRELARRQGVSYANARQRVSRALEMLRTSMGKSGKRAPGFWSGFAGIFGLRLDATTQMPPALGTGLFGSGIVGIGGVLMSAKSWAGVALAAISVTLAVQLQQDDSIGAGAVPGALVIETDGAAAQGLPTQTEELGVVTPAAEREVASGRTEAASLPIAAGGNEIHGIVKDGLGEPLAEVALQWRDQDGEPVPAEAPSTTASDGSFRSEQPDGGVTVEFRRARSLSAWFTTQPDSIAMESLSFDEPLAVVLLACPRLKGVVHGADGNPVAPPGEVSLQLLNADGTDGGSFDTDIQADGSYLFDNLPVGSVRRIKARAKGSDELKTEGEWPLVAQTTTKLNLDLPRGITVVGTVLDAESKMPIPFAEVWTSGFTYDASSSSPTAIANADGRFRLEGVTPSDMDNLPENLQFVWIAGNSPEHIPTPFDGKFARHVEPGVFEVDLELIPGSCSLHVVFYEEGGESAASGMQVWSIDSQRNFVHSSTNSEGELQLESLPPGEIMLSAYRPHRGANGLYSSAALTLDLVAGAHERHEVELNSDAATAVTGRVTESDGTPAAGVKVSAGFVLHFNGLTLAIDSESTLTDELGRYSLTGLRAGRQKIRTDRVGLPGEKSFELDWGESREVDFLLGEDIDIRGTVEFGEITHHHLDVMLFLRGGGEALAEDVPSTDGTFEFTGIPAAEYEVVLLHDGERLDAIPVASSGGSGMVLRVE